MGKPIMTYSDPLHGAISEIISALSSLHMEAEPMPAKDLPDKDNVQFMDETLLWVNHATEHLHEAIKQINKAAEKEVK
jgi:hypothetical protein